MFLLILWSPALFSSSNGLEHANNNTTSNISAIELFTIADQVFEIIAKKCSLAPDLKLKYLQEYINNLTRGTFTPGRYNIKLNEYFANTKKLLDDCLTRTSQSPDYHPEELPETTSNSNDSKSIWNEFESVKGRLYRTHKNLFVKSNNLTLTTPSESSEVAFKKFFKKILSLIVKDCLPNQFHNPRSKYLLDIMDGILNTVLADSEIHLVHQEYLEKTNFVAQIKRCIGES